MKQIAQFLITYNTFVFWAMFGALAIVAITNFVCNVYANQNAKLNKFRKKIVEKPSSLQENVKLLPLEYQRQWRAYQSSNTNKPSAVFEFVKKHSPYKLWFVHLLATTLCASYVLLAFFTTETHYFLTVQAVFVSTSLLVILLKRWIDTSNVAMARRYFGRFVHDLNVVVQINKDKKVAIAVDTTQEIAKLEDTPCDDVVARTIQVLKQKGLENDRTVEEQRKLNLALNNLLQACSKKKA